MTERSPLVWDPDTARYVPAPARSTEYNPRCSVNRDCTARAAYRYPNNGPVRAPWHACKAHRLRLRPEVRIV